MEEMIFDRTQEDVDYARKNPSDAKYLKGTLNYIDLNRIEKKYIEIVNKMKLLGENVTINPIKTFTSENDEWKMTDLISIEKINQIRQNVYILQQETQVEVNLNIEFTNNLNYKQLNNLEKILYEIDEAINRVISTFVYAGTIYCGEEIIAY